MKKRQLIMAAGLAGALSVTGVAFATTDLETSVSTQNVAAAGFVSVAAADGKTTGATGGNYGTPPSWSPTANSAGAVNHGDLYVISPDSASTTGDFVATLYLSNPGALSKDYNYINFKVTVYKYDGTSTWTAVSNTTTYLSLANGYVTFDLTAPDYTKGERYGISIDSGSYYCVNTDTTTNALAPNFYLTVKPA